MPAAKNEAPLGAASLAVDRGKRPRKEIAVKGILLYSLGGSEGGEASMSKTVTLRLDDAVYQLFKTVAERENRPLSNFIESAVTRFVQEYETVDEFEMAEIRNNTDLNRSLKRGLADARRRRGTFV